MHYQAGRRKESRRSDAPSDASSDAPGEATATRPRGAADANGGNAGPSRDGRAVSTHHRSIPLSLTQINLDYTLSLP